MEERKFILNLAPTGMIPTKEMTPYVPVTPNEITEQVLDAAARGISMVHLHARDPVTGCAAYQKEIYADIIRGIRKSNRDLLLCVSTSGRVFAELEKRADCLDLDGDLKPDFATLTLSSLNFHEQASVNSPQLIQDLAKKMSERGIKPELEVFDVGMINYAKFLIRKGFLTPPFYFNLILGNIASAQADLLHLGLMVRELPEGAFWSVGGIGPFQLGLNIMGIVSGGGVRIGLEDNIWFDVGKTRLASNRDLVQRIVSIAEMMGCRPYTPREARGLLGV